jgi:nitrogen-specific signal transduction histidine kinase/AmiR/NasT family two-component response regulator
VQPAELDGRAVDVVFAVDISARLAAEKEQERLQLQLQHAQKMEAIGQLAGGVAHDFNNLLMAIGGFAEILCEDGNEEVKEIASEIARAQARGTTLTRQLLAFARKDVVQPRVWDPGLIVRELQPLLKRLVGEPVELLIDERACRPLWVDRGQFEQMVINLVANSRDALNAHGRIVISVHDVTSAASPEPWVQVSVADDGHGMDEATRARIFEPFFTTKPKHKGTGLGLAVVHGIVVQHGGRVEVQSVPGGGTTVSTFWPAARTDLVGDQGPPDPSAPTAAPVPGTTVVVADDDDGARAYLRRVLERAGYRVVDAPDGLRALDVARQHRPEVELLLTDVVMPGLSGFELADRFRTEFPGKPVLFMSGYIDERVAASQGKAARPAVVYKPFKSADLLALVADALQRRDRAREILEPRAAAAGE